ncbi:hypothetical protein D3C81_1379580 [compost metagenome]
MHRTAQAAQWAGDGEGHQQAEQGQHHQRYAQSAEWPQQAVTVPGVQLRMRDAIDQQVGVTAVRAGVFLCQAPPGQVSFVVVATRLKGCGAAREGSWHNRLTTVVEHLNIDVVSTFASLKKVLGRVRTLLFVVLGPFLRQGVEARMSAEDPGVLVQHVPKQDRQARDQGNGQPETGQNAPEQ